MLRVSRILTAAWPGTEGWTDLDWVKDWVTRYKLPVDDQGRVRLYHATPRPTAKVIASQGLKKGSYMTDTPERAVFQGRRDRGLKTTSMVCFEVWIPMDAFHATTWAILDRALTPQEMSLKKVNFNLETS